PCELTRVRIIGSEIPAVRELAARDTDDDFPFRDSRRHRQGVVLLKDGDLSFPHDLSTFGIERVESAVNHWGDDLAPVNRNASIDNAAAHFRTHGSLIDLRVPTPDFLACPGIDSEDDAPVRDAI